MQKPNEEKIEQWCNFIVDHLYANDLIAYRDLKKTGKRELNGFYSKEKQKECCLQMLLSLESNDYDTFYYTDIKKIKNCNKYDNFEGDKNPPNYKIMESDEKSSFYRNPKKDSKFKKMTNRQYLQWRLEHIKDGYGEHIPEEPISLIETIGYALSSLIGVSLFLVPNTLTLITILTWILNIFAVATLISFIVCNLSLYFLIPAAVVYGLSVLASCIHIGCRYKEGNVKYQGFISPYNDIMEYLNQSKPPESLEAKMSKASEEDKKYKATNQNTEYESYLAEYYE